MPAGTQISGEDGVIALYDFDDDSLIGEIPCLESWTLDASASISERATKCMKSNGDGGSDSDGAWTKGTVESKNWSVAANFFWQEDQTIPAAVKIDATNVGQKVKVKLYPRDNVAGRVVYSGTAIIESISDPSEVTGDVKVTANLKGDGALAKAAVA